MMLARPPSAAAQRKRRYRQRQKSGRVVVPVEIERDSILLALIISRLLSDHETLQPDQVAAALGDVLAEWARRWRD